CYDYHRDLHSFPTRRSSDLRISDHSALRGHHCRGQRCFAKPVLSKAEGLNMTRYEMLPQNWAKYSSPSRRRMLDTAASSPIDAALRCSRVCCCRRVYVAASTSRSAAAGDSASAPATGSIRFAESADRQRRCKSARPPLRDSTIKKEPPRCRPDALD